jgi:hypothetical protein
MVPSNNDQLVVNNLSGAHIKCIEKHRTAAIIGPSWVFQQQDKNLLKGESNLALNHIPHLC